MDLDVSPSDKRETLQVGVEGRTYDVTYGAVSDHHFHMVVDGRITSAYVVRSEGAKYISVNGQSFFVQDEDRPPARRRKPGGPEDTPGEVTPPMPSVVVRILVEEGEEVKKGQALVVVTAMKMETSLTAPISGRVKRINTVVNAKVVPGDILVEIEPLEENLNSEPQNIQCRMSNADGKSPGE